MAVITTAEKDLLQGQKHKTRLFCSPLVPDTLWTAKIDDPGIEIGETDIAFDNGSGISFSRIRVQSEVWIGTAAEKHDIGRARVRGTTSGDNGATGTINIAPNSFQFVDNLWLTFKFDFPLKPKYSYVDPNTEEFFKDYDRSYSFENSTPPPVVIAGPHQANFIDEALGHWEKTVDLSLSYTIAEGATISSYGMEVLEIPGNSFTTSFDTNTGLGWIRFEDPGNYWVKYTVTDSNGIGQQSWRWYRVHEDDPISAHYPLVDFRLNLSGGWEQAAWQAGITARDGFAVDEFPDRALTVIWQDSYYDGTRQLISRLPNDATNVFTGYVISSDDTYDLAEGIADADFALQSVTGRLQNLYGFSLTLRAIPGTVDEWYLFEEWMTTGVAVHHLLRWQTTALETTDVFGLRDDTLKRVGAMTQEGTIHGMAHTLCWEQGVRTKLVSDMGGRMHMTPDHQLLTDSERTGLGEVMAIEEADRSGPIVIHRRQTRAAPLVTVSGVNFDGTFNGGDETDPNVSAYCAQAPGAFAHDDGPAPTSLDNQLFTSQAHANEIAGRLDAQVNNPIPRVDIEFHGHYLSVLEFAYEDYYTLTLQAGDTPRGLWVGEKKLFLREVTLQADEYGALSVSAGFEPEAEGHDGVETVCPGLPTLGGFPDPPPIEEDLRGGLDTSSSVHFKSPLGTSWEQKLIEDTLDMVEDPFWPFKTLAGGSSEAILFRCGAGYIKRTTDNWTSNTDVTPATVGGNASSGIDFVALEGNFLVSDGFACVARLESGGAWTSWLLYTDDNGATWSEVELSGLGGDPTIDSLGPDTLIHDNTRTLEGNNSNSALRNLAALGGDKFVAATIAIDADDFQQIQVQACSVSGDTITPGAKYDVNTTASADTPINMDVVALNADDFLIVWVQFDETLNGGLGHHKVSGRVGTVTGTAIAWGTEEVIWVEDGTDVIQVAACRLGDELSAIAWVTGPRDIYIAVWLTSPGGMTMQAEDFISDNGDNGISCDVLPGTQNFVVAYKRNDSGDAGGHAVVCEWDSPTLTIGTPQQFSENNTDDVDRLGVVGLDSDLFVAVYQLNTGFDRFGYAVAGSVSGTTITFGAYNQFTGEARLLSVDGISATNFFVHSQDDSQISKLRIGTVSGTTVSFGPATTPTADADEGVSIVAGVLSASKAIASRNEPGAQEHRGFTVNMSGGTAALSKANGVAIDKSAGTHAWVTGYGSGDTLVMVEVHLGTMSITDDLELGAATLAQFDAETYVVWPRSAPDGSLYLFGRMQAPQGLPDPTHVLYYDFVAAQAVESGWGADVCGALLVEADGTVSAVRNISGSVPKLYRGDNVSLSLKCTLSFTAGVNPHGITASPFTGDLFLGADAGQEIMVLQVQPPFSVSDIVDLTFDHPTDEGITAVVLL